MITTALKARIRDTLLGMPVFAKVMSIALGMAVFFGAGMVWQIREPYFRLETQEVEEHAVFVAQALAVGAAPLMRSGKLLELQELLEEMAKVTPAMGACVKTLEVQDGRGGVVAKVSQPPPVGRQGRVIEKTGALPGGLPGSVYVALNDSHIDFELAWHTRRIVATTGIIGLLGIAATWWLMRIVIRPIHELVESQRAVKAGNYQARATVRTRDEVGELAASFNEMMAALQQKDAANHQLMRKIITAEEEERKRVARELHDHTGQALTSLIASLAALEPGEHPKKLTDLLALATQTLSDVHDLSRTLRPSVLDEVGLVPALQKLCEGLAKQLGLKVDFAAIGLEENTRLPRSIEVALYRIGQEALTNAVRHGQARSVEMLLHRKAASVLAVIEDDGRGFDAQNWRAQCLCSDHLGLLGIEERAALLGGTFRVESRPGAGMSLFVEIPLAETPHG